MKPIFIGNTKNLIDWDKVISDIENKPGDKLPKWNWDHPEFLKIKHLYESSGYLPESAEWINYYAETGDYDEEVNKLFGEFVGKTKFARVWISRINPGRTAPWHWDIDDLSNEFESAGSLIRYTARINKDGTGQVALVDDYAIIGGEQGDVYEWTDTKLWHGSANVGYTVKYQFNCLAFV